MLSHVVSSRGGDGICDVCGLSPCHFLKFHLSFLCCLHWKLKAHMLDNITLIHVSIFGYIFLELGVMHVTLWPLFKKHLK